MDQLKPFIQWCKKNAFWLGCFFLSVTMIGSWVFSSMQLAEAQRENEREISKKLGDIEKVTKTKAEGADEVNAHPNKSTQDGMDAEIDRTISSIVRAWKKRYNEQKKILTWPEDILGAETCNFFSKVDIPEKVSAPGLGFEKYRRQYYEKIPEFMNRICLDVGANWKYNEKLNEEKAREKREAQEGNSEGGGMGMGGMGMGGMGMGGMGMGGGEGNTSLVDEINQYPVTWDEVNQALWNRKLKTFQGFDDHKEPVLYPTFMQANMLQQDLWLLEAMFKNIKKINAGSKSNDISVIRQIDHVVFGREATVKLGELLMVDARLAVAESDDAAAGAAGGMGMGGMGGMGGDGMGGVGGDEEGLPAEPSSYHVRYVDPNYEPIAASQVKAVLGGAALPETNLELIVAKRVPFRLAVRMDERKVNEFIAICANSEFVFEINQLRVNRHVANDQIAFNGGATASSGGPGMGSGMGSMSDASMGGMSMGMGGMGGDSGPAAPTEKLKPTPVESRTDFMVSIEFYGVVKIYNPVRENFLRLAAGQEVVDETADPSMEAPAAPKNDPPADNAAGADAPADGDAKTNDDAAAEGAAAPDATGG